jgi:hypothetical protein
MPRSPLAPPTAARPALLVPLLCSALVACGGRSEDARRESAAIARGSNPPGLVTMTVCGRVLTYRAGVPDAGGRLELDCGAWDLEPQAPVAFEVLLAPTEYVCVHAELASDQRIHGAYVFRPSEADRAADAPPPLRAAESATSPDGEGGRLRIGSPRR